MRHIITIIWLSVFFYSCARIPQKAVAVQPFDQSRYLGKWYEIARLDFKFERDLDNTSAEYSLNKNGTIKVVNKGYNYRKKEWKQAIGKAKFRGADTIGELKVSFFGPFYAGYNVIAIDQDYKYALVAGRNTDYLWILSRETTLPETVKNEYLKIADRIGYATADLVWVKHDQK